MCFPDSQMKAGACKQSPVIWRGESYGAILIFHWCVDWVGQKGKELSRHKSWNTRKQGILNLNDLVLCVVKVNGFGILKFGTVQNAKKMPAASRPK